MNKVLNKTAGVVLTTACVASKLAQYGLSAAMVVGNGAVNMANAFVNSPVKVGIGAAMLGSVQKGVDKLGSYLLKQGKNYWNR